MLEELPRLEGLHLHLSPSVSEVDLTRLAGRVELAYLSINSVSVTDAGLAHLAELPRLRRLRRLDIRGTRVTMAGVERLRQALPECRIACDPAADPRLRRLHAWRGLEPG
jgi:hypothetical protein